MRRQSHRARNSCGPGVFLESGAREPETVGTHALRSRAKGTLFLEGGMDFLVQLEDNLEPSPVLAHVNSVPAPLDSERPSRDVVTLYGAPSTEALALALVAALEGRRDGDGPVDTIRHLGVWAERGAVGDAAWRDGSTGQLMTRDLMIPLDRLSETASRIIGESGQVLRRLIAGLAMPDWPEGSRRAITFTLAPIVAGVGTTADSDALLDALRQGAGLAYEGD
jgi:hypothetical protein